VKFQLDDDPGDIAIRKTVDLKFTEISNERSTHIVHYNLISIVVRFIV
jgi:hypothetical protein